MTKHRPLFRRRARAFRVALLLGGFAVLSWIGGFIWFAQNIPMTTPDSPAPTDAIVVLTGGSGRLHEGLDLLASGLGVSTLSLATATRRQAGKLGFDSAFPTLFNSETRIDSHSI